MIYDYPQENEPIKQGDVFRWIPCVDFSLLRLPFVDEDANNAIKNKRWIDLAFMATDKPRLVVVEIRPAYGIVISQNCDAYRSSDITLCEILPFRVVEKYSAQISATNIKGRVDIITQHARKNQKWFYLPPDDKIGLKDKMAVDFRAITKVNRMDLEELRTALRVGRLNNVALAHFRERISEFFRRYAYDE